MEERKALQSVVRAWESLPTGDYRPREIERWLQNQMWHAVNDAREALGQKRSDRDAAE